MSGALNYGGDSLVLQRRGRSGNCGVTTMGTTEGVVVGQTRDVLSAGRRLQRTTGEEHEVLRGLWIIRELERLGLRCWWWCQRA